jgi:hypothetical protein
MMSFQEAATRGQNKLGRVSPFESVSMTKIAATRPDTAFECQQVYASSRSQPSSRDYFPDDFSNALDLVRSSFSTMYGRLIL